MDLEARLESFEKREQREKPFSKIKRAFISIEDYLNDHPFVGSVLGVGALEALSYFVSSKYVYYIDLNHRFGQLLGEILLITPHFYLNKQLNEKKFDSKISSLKKVVTKLCWEYPIVPAIFAEGLYLLNTFDWNVQETIQNAKAPWLNILTTFYLGISMTTKAIRTYEDSIVGDFFGAVGRNITSRSEFNEFFKKNPEKIKKQYQNAEDFLRRSLDTKFKMNVAIDLFYSHLKLDHIDEASVLLMDIVEYIGKEKKPNFAEKLPRKGFSKVQDFYERYEGENEEYIKNSLEILYAFTSSEKEEIIDFFNNFDGKLNDDIFGLMLAGKFFSGLGETEKSKEYLLKLLDALPETLLTEKDISRLGYSRRTVEVIDVPEFQSSFVFKDANSNQAKMQGIVTKEFEEQTTTMITYLKDEGVLVEERANSKISSNLHDLLPYLKKKEIINAIEKVSLFLADFQSTDFEEKGIILENVLEDNEDYYGDRINELFIKRLSEFSSSLDPKTTAQLKDDAYVIGRIASKLPVAPYWDANLKNILYLFDETIKVTDFENTSLKIKGIDWISLTEFGSQYLDEDVKARIIWNGFKRNNPEITSQEISRDVLFGGMIRHPELFGYRARDASYFEEELRLECIDSMLYHLSKSAEYSSSIANSQIIDSSDKVPFYRFSKNIQRIEPLIREEYQEEINNYKILSLSKEQEINEKYNPLRKNYLLNTDMWKTVTFFGTAFGGLGWGAFKLVSELKEFTDKILTNLQP